MAKRDRHIRGHGTNYEVSEHLDDHILPAAEEILRYKEADATLPVFIQETARNEQLFRHKMNDKAMKLSFREQGLQHGLNYLGMICAVLIGIAGMWFSYKLLLLGYEVHGTVFSGVIVIYMIYIFVRRNLPAKKKMQ